MNPTELQHTNQPVEPQFQTAPVVPPPSGAPTPPLTVLAPMTPTPPKKKRSAIKIIFFIVISIVIIAIASFFSWSSIQTLISHYQVSQQKSSESQLLQTVKQEGVSITSDALSKLDKTTLFFAIFKNAAEQRVVRTKIGSFSSNKAHDNSTITDAQDTTFDYQTKVYSHDSDSYSINPASPDKIRCINGDQYDFVSLYPEDGWQKATSNQYCTTEAVNDFYVGDGVNAGGLTSDQADTFIGALRALPNFFTVDTSSIVKYNDKSFIKLTATVTPQKDTEGDYWGMQNFMWAFKDTGITPSALPYSYAGAGGDGLKIAYYVDPATQLPVYAQYDTTEILEGDGKPKAEQLYDYRHVEYGFGGSVPTLDLHSHDPISFAWPTDRM
jgi:flagellar basal body-associated protein FliL